MKLAYIFIRFPVWSETFAINDVIHMHKSVDCLDIYNLRINNNENSDVEFKDFDKVKSGINNASIFTLMSGLFIMLIHPVLLAFWTRWLIRNEISRPITLLKCLVLGPQCFYIWSKIKKNNYDVVHLFWGHYTATIGYLLKKTKLKTKLSTFLGAYDLELGLGVSVNVANSADTVWTHSEYNIRQMVNLGINQTKIKVAYRGVDFTPFESASFKKNRFKITAVGRLTKPKAFDDVIRVFYQLVHVFPNLPLELHLLGSGPEEGYLKNLCTELHLEKYITFHGRVNHEDVLKELATSEIFLFMSKYKGDRLPNVVKEAMASKCVCIVSNTAGIEEIVENEKEGFVVEMGDIHKAAEICESILSEKINTLKIKDDAYLKVKNHFTVSSSRDKYLNEWKNLF